jgi:hypothetical protein
MASAIADKAARMEESGAEWLRLIPYNHFFLLTHWAQLPLAEKLNRLAYEVRSSLAGRLPSGVVVSSGAGLYSDDVTEETIREADGITMRRRVRPLRARETLIIPITDKSRHDRRLGGAARYRSQMAPLDAFGFDFMQPPDVGVARELDLRQLIAGGAVGHRARLAHMASRGLAGRACRGGEVEATISGNAGAIRFAQQWRVVGGGRRRSRSRLGSSALDHQGAFGALYPAVYR